MTLHLIHSSYDIDQKEERDEEERAQLEKEATWVREYVGLRNALIVDGRIFMYDSPEDIEDDEFLILARLEGIERKGGELGPTYEQTVALKLHTHPMLKDAPRWWRRTLYFAKVGNFHTSYRNPIPHEINHPYKDLLLKQAPSYPKKTAKDTPLFSDSPLIVRGTMSSLSLASQRFLPILDKLTGVADVDVLMIPDLSVSSFPLPNFYRAKLTPDSAPLKFDRLPAAPLLTLRHDTTQRWNIQYVEEGEGRVEGKPTSTVHDFDNLRDTDGTTPHSVTTLKGLVVPGRCFEAKGRESAQGMQIELWQDHRSETPATPPRS